MKISTFWYCLRQGIKNIWKNKLFSLASVGTIAACVFLLCVFYSITSNFQNMVKTMESSVGITVFFNEGMAMEAIQAIGEEIALRPEVERMRFISSDEAWEEFRQDYFKDAPNLADGYVKDNPLAECDSYEIFLKDVENQDEFVEYLKGLNGVRKVNYSALVADALVSVNRLITLVSAGILIILLAVAIFLIANKISLSIAVRKEEIRIMKLIGATNFFIREPFVVEGLLIGLVGASLPLVVVYQIYEKVVGFAMEKFSILSGVLVFLPVNQVFGILTPVALILGAGIGFFGSIFSIRRHLRV
ncbi:permease-like cell division protein FtsX [Lachnotalea sp. AF33-28]|uniref:permease-like cell division protein FtsX n=1 Tax=Lachnotalea sp. AF33-28 TaxID=2292046 RepID=UPI000E49BBB8|nr:permease-like cell division protein FtsX [Lachnotalea sp. AF33-28]RHP34881.1 ABC transporter permease [Lachnotalea sp. AF33-28]